ncbi:MAG: tRNA N6-adenosine threonylcarbamoyltransferase [Planctomycetota bacterium]|nr:MAG: tRNA N6-adenosine threonylcarbamoyltransferase [Planctomycetota bacterium]
MSLILGLESSCDETAAALVRDGHEVLAERVASQAELHARFGGVIPEVASRSHLEVIFPVIQTCLDEAGVTLAEVDGVAVTNQPGLIGCLLVGLSTAKGFALALDLPLIPVNHVHAHVYGALMGGEDAGGAAGNGPTAPESAPWPLASLVVSGGHTTLYESGGPQVHRPIGRTLDDAAGEAYDKVSALLGLGYPGGPLLDKLAADGDPKAYAFPRPLPSDSLDFSFSGLKTAVLYALRGPQGRDPLPADLVPADVAASFQAAAVDVLAKRLLQAARRIQAGGLVVCGGVAANSGLRARLKLEAERAGLPLFMPPMRLATDNAVMVAGLGHHVQRAGHTADLSLDALPRGD